MFVILLQADPLWSGKLLRSDPQLLEAIHLDYLNNGADIIITASYQVRTITLISTSTEKQ